MRVGRDAPRGIEAPLEPRVQLEEVLLHAPSSIWRCRLLHPDRDQRRAEQALDVLHRGHESRALLLMERLEEAGRYRIRAPVELAALGASAPGEADDADAAIFPSRFELDQSLALERLQDARHVAGVQPEAEPQRTDLDAVSADLPESPRLAHRAVSSEEVAV